jgi:hypothetical protein
MNKLIIHQNFFAAASSLYQIRWSFIFEAKRADRSGFQGVRVLFSVSIPGDLDLSELAISQ